MILTLLKNKTVLTVLATVIVIGGIGYGIYSLYQQNQQLKAQLAQLTQEYFATGDSLSKTRDSVQVLTTFVRDLNTDKELWKKRYIAVKDKYDILIATTIDTGSAPIDTAGGIPDTIKVAFIGKKGIVNYNGMTYYIWNSQTKAWSITITIDSITIVSEIFKDAADGLYKIKTISQTPGVTLIGYSTIDKELFRKIVDLPPLKDSNKFGPGMLIAYDRVYGGLVYKPSDWMFSAHYKLFERQNLNEVWYDRFLIGAHYFVF